MTRDIVKQLDAFIQKRRYIAQGDTNAGGPKAGPKTKPGNEDDDVPVLTEIVDDEAVGIERPDMAEAATLDLDAIAADLASVLHERLVTELPQLLDQAFAHMSSELRAGMAGIAEAAVRDVLERHRPFSDEDVSRPQR